MLCEPSNGDGVGISESRGIEAWLRRLGPLKPGTVQGYAMNALTQSRVRKGKTVFFITQRAATISKLCDCICLAFFHNQFAFQRENDPGRSVVATPPTKLLLC
jgi:hypothetical protein